MENLKKEIKSIVDIYKSGDLSKAENLAKILINREPNIVFLHNLIGLIYVGMGKINLALKHYEKGLEIDPNFAMIYNNLGLIYTHNIVDNKKAEENFKKSISLDQNTPEAFNNLATLYKSLNKFDEALIYYKKSILVDPKFVPGYHNLGNIFTAIGNFSEAKKNFYKAIELNPFYTNSHRTLSRQIKYTKNEKHLKDLKEIYKKINVSDVENKINISFALGKALEDIKEYDRSFLLYQEGNKLYEKKINYSMNKEKDKFSKIKSTFHKKLFEKYSGTGINDSSGIFILGMPRSGTTLVEQILSSHSKVYGGDEQETLGRLLQTNFGNKNLSLLFEGILDFDKNMLKDIANDYINEMKKISNNSEKITDKMPENFFWIGLIKLILPNSKIIHTFRNSQDNCFSIYKNHFPGGKLDYSYNLNQIVDYYNLYKELMDFWDNLLPNFIYNIKY